MLKSLRIQNIILVDDIEIEFQEGLNVITGETGAGKSIILNSLNLVTGKAASVNLVGKDNKTAIVTAIFDISSNIDESLEQKLDQLSIEHSGELIVRRYISLSGKNKAYINDVIVSLSTLRSITSGLCEIHSQREQQSILDASKHRGLVDTYAYNMVLLKEIANVYDKIQSVSKKISNIEQTKIHRLQEKAFIEFAVKELEQLEVKTNEEAGLIDTRIYLKTQKKREDLITQIINELNNSDIESILFDIQKTMLSNTDTFSQYIEQTSIISNATENAVDEVAKIKEAFQSILEISPSSSDLVSIEERLFALRDASNKYHVPTDKLPDFLGECRQKLESLSKYQDAIDLQNKILSDYKDKYHKIAKQISQSRCKAALVLEQKVKSELLHLKLEKAIFKIKVETDNSINNINIYGQDKVSFLVSTNPGQGLSSLAKIASGGELSRFMLAIKVILANKKNNSILVFDEIDTGIGGATADAVGQRLKKLSSCNQLLVVTHHPQVASKADLHLLVTKRSKDNVTVVSIKALSTIQKKEEVARMLSGSEVTTEALAAADRLIQTGTDFE